MSHQQLRNRSTMNNNRTASDDNDVLTTRSGAGLSANGMITASPSHHSKVYKLQVPLLFSVLPSFLQKIICSWACLSFLAPKWKERYLIQIGNYMYRFKSPTSSTPKGAPVPLEMVDARILRSIKEEGVEYVPTPPSVGAVIVVSTYKKKQYYGVSSRDEALVWVNSIEQGKQEATRRSMGHAKEMPYPKSWQYYDTLGDNYAKSKERIQTKIAESEVREMEMTSFGERGALPQGYYG